MTFYSDFSDLNGKIYNVEITNSAQGGDTYVTMTGDPCTLETSSNGLFDYIKAKSCTLNIVVHHDDSWYFNLYDPTSRGTKVKVYEYDQNYPNGVKKVIFRGNLVPSQYDQTWTYIDSITLDCIDAVSTCKDFRWTDNGQYNSFIDILLPMLHDAGYQGILYVPRVYDKINNDYSLRESTPERESTPDSPITGDVLDKLTVSSGNFIDDDDEHTKWTQYEVITEILKFLNWSLVTDGDDVWLIDYRAEGRNEEVITYSEYDILNKVPLQETYPSSTTLYNMNMTMLAGGTTNISLDDCFNKIDVSDNLYKIEEISPDIFDDGNHISVSEEIQEESGVNPLNIAQWQRQKTKGWWFWKKTETLEPDGFYYQTLCRMNPLSNWTHYFYRISDMQELNNYENKGYYDAGSRSIYTSGLINKYINTHCCLMQHYAYVKDEGPNKVPSSLDWTSVLTFFVTDDTVGGGSGKLNMSNLDGYEKKVLEYQTPEKINWKPSSGTSWIVIKGDLWYQYNGEKYGDKDKNTLNTISQDKRYYITAPVDKIGDIPETVLYGGLCARVKTDTNYNKGFDMWRMRVQIGEDGVIGTKYWSGSSWIGNPTDFYIQYNNDPSYEDGDPETVPAFKWIHCVNNSDYKDKVGVDGYAIPIKTTDDVPIDKMKITIYTPRLYPVELSNLLNTIFDGNYIAVNWYDVPNMIYCKDFSIDYIYTDTQAWYNNHDNTNKQDLLYTGKINDTFVQTFDTIEMKINTSNPDQPISRSYVIAKLPHPTEQNKFIYPYLTTMKHISGDEEKVQEFNVVDAYLDHNSDPKPIIEANIHGLVNPTTKFSKNQIAGTFVVDSQSFDVRNNNNRIKIIAF